MTDPHLSRRPRERTCAWCRGPISPGARADALTCSQPCRQARHRFRVGVGCAPPGVAGGLALRLAYADPPYPGLSRRYYRDHPDYAGEVDHAQLVADLSGFDGWALSTSALALPHVLASCPPGTRVAAWHRGERPTRSRWPLNAWEPVIYSGGRRVVSDVDARRVDSLVYRAGVRRTDPDRVIGAKPAVFARWVFDLLGALPGDHFIDVFPGSGGMSRAWLAYSSSGVAS